LAETLTGDIYFIDFEVENYCGCLIFATKFKRVMIMYLLQASTVAHDPDSSFWYLPVGVQLLFAIFFVIVMMGVSHWLGPKRKTADKLEIFASGIKSHGDARQPMAIKYFLVAILFVLFDVEVIFFYPYAVNFKSLGWNGFFAVLMFVGFFLAGFVYIIKKGALRWED
jgi:NADH-quinone oxidoreductase subunit A